MRITKPIERWFNCENDPDGGKVKIRHLRPGEVQDIIDQVWTQRVEYKPGDEGATFAQSTDKKKDREMTICAAVTDWENFFGLSGKPLKCTDANKIRALREIDGFEEMIGVFRKRISEDIAKEKEDQEKN